MSGAPLPWDGSGDKRDEMSRERASEEGACRI